MATPITIENLANGTVKPCPFEDGQKITGEDYEWFSSNYPAIASELCFTVYEASLGYESGETFKMPDGYYHLPPDKQLGLPLGRWSSTTLSILVSLLPFGVLQQYCNNVEIAIDCGRTSNGKSLELNDFGAYFKWFEIKKQPPNLYNPLDHKEVVLMEDNSANEEQPAKETKTMELPWQDISNLKPNNSSCILWKKNIAKGEIPVDFSHDVLAFLNKDEYTHWLPITQPKAPKVEAPAEPERVDAREFCKQFENKAINYWMPNYNSVGYIEANGNVPYHQVVTAIREGAIFYATDPTAWLAWKAEQEGNTHE
jgi:hypothetical protein